MILQGTVVNHKKLGKGVVQELYKNLHPHFEDLHMCYIKLDTKPSNFGTDIVPVFEEDLEIL